MFEVNIEEPPEPRNLWHQLLGNLLAITFPSVCFLCGQNLHYSLAGGPCGDCWCALQPWHGSLCFRCGLPLPGQVDDPGFLCADCRRGQPHFDLARSYGVYARKLRSAILQVKFHAREQFGMRLGQLLIEPWQALDASTRLAGPIQIIPVPLHRSRERERGYNQARLLAGGFLRAARAQTGALEMDLAPRCLKRKRSTVPQSGLNLSARAENVRNVFEVAQPGAVRERDVVLVDDVMTTGATASACAAALKRAGARRVLVLTLARATPEFSDL